MKLWVLGTNSTAKARLCFGPLANHYTFSFAIIFSITAAVIGIDKYGYFKHDTNPVKKQQDIIIIMHLRLCV